MAAVDVVCGDLFDQDVDAIVNPWNCNLFPWWLLIPQGVSGALRKRAGLEPFKQLRNIGIIPIGSAVMTTAGRLHYRAIVHVAGINWFWVATDKSIGDSVRSAILLADTQQFESLAMPLIGAGTGGKDSERAMERIVTTASAVETQVKVVVVRYSPEEKRR